MPSFIGLIQLRDTRGWMYDQKHDVAVWLDQGYEIDLKRCRLSPDECMNRINRLKDSSWCTAACLAGFMSMLRHLEIATSRTQQHRGEVPVSGVAAFHK